jgi:DNA invertase Pin-like site-specific DNA recombinase
MISRPPQVTDGHLRRKALVYIRQSSPQQVREAVGSTAVQRDLVSKLSAWGWGPTMIEVVDEDLGVSGSWTGTRGGFNRLLERMRADEIGIVLDVDSSRLARNDADFFRFGEVARRHRVLLAHGDQIIDFTDPNSAFIGGILGLNATRENRVRVQLSVQARRKKAEMGIAPTAPGVGYVRRPDGAWFKDADLRVREVITLVIDKGLEIGSIRGTLKFLRTHHIQLPRRSRRGMPPVWVDATYGMVADLLKNPVYAGRYTYGRTVLEPPAEGSRRGRQRPQPPSTWIVIEQHHEPYIDPARWAQLQQQIAANRRTVGPPLGRGEALVQGRLRCTLHGTTFFTVYDLRLPQSEGEARRQARYLCRPDWEVAGSLAHQSIRAFRMDAVIERALLDILSPIALDGLQEAIRQELRQHESLVRGRQDELRRAQQAVAEAERNYVHADPTHVHLKGRLGERADQALRDLEDLQTRHRLQPLIPPLTLDDAMRAELRELVSDLPRLWRHPSVTAERRKAIVRAVIKVIHVTPAPEAWPLEIEWVSGVRTTLRVTRADRAPARPPKRPPGPWREIDPGAYPFIRNRVATGMALSAIAEALNAAGVPHPRGVWRIKSVQRAIARLRRGEIPGVEPPPAPPTLMERIRALYHQGHAPAEIVSELRGQHVQTRHQTLVTREVVYKALERLGLPTHFTIANQAISSHLRAWSPTATPGEIAERLNGLGFTTKLSRPWTPVSVREKLRDLGIPFTRCRGASAPVADAAEGVPPGADE